MHESEKTEFKSDFTNEIYNSVVAFANSSGGTIYVGIDDNGEISEVDDVDDLYTRVTNGIRDAISPDVTIFIDYTIRDDGVIKIEVGEGSYKPYYLKSKGIKPSGVYVRQGASSVQASFEQIRQMIKNADLDVYENMRSLDQNLTFNYAKKFFEKYGVEFAEEKYSVLGLINSMDKQYTNLAKLISDQCKHSVKIAVFANEENTIFRDTREFKGSIFEQLDMAYSYLLLCNKTSAKIHGLERQERKDYSDEALREALINAIVHRDYSFSGSIIININDKEMEFVSLGGLIDGITLEDIKEGISQTRNTNLASIFFRLHLIEAYGTGIKRIFETYKNSIEKPILKASPNVFKIILPNLSYETKAEFMPTQQQKMVIDYIDKYGSINQETVEEILNVKRTRSYKIIKSLIENNVIKKKIVGKSKVYIRA